MGTQTDYAATAFRKTDAGFDAAICEADAWVNDAEVVALMAAYNATNDETRLGMYDAICDRLHAIRNSYIIANASGEYGDDDHLDSLTVPVSAVLPVWGGVA